MSGKNDSSGLNADLDFKDLTPENVAELTKEYLEEVAIARGLDKLKSAAATAVGDKRILGGFIGELDWWCQFEFLPEDNHWKAHFLDEADNWTELEGVGETPLRALKSLVARYSFANGGTPSHLLGIILQSVDDCFEDDGYLKANILTGLEENESLWVK